MIGSRTPRLWLGLALTAGFAVLLTHTSQRPLIAGRYSSSFALLLGAYLVLAFAALSATAPGAARLSPAPAASRPRLIADVLLAAAVLHVPHALRDAAYAEPPAYWRLNPLVPRFVALSVGTYLALALIAAGLGLLVLRACRRIANERGVNGSDAWLPRGLALALTGVVSETVTSALGHQPRPDAALLLSVLGCLAVCGLVALGPRALWPHAGWLFAFVALLLGSLGTVRPHLLAAPDAAFTAALGALALALLQLRIWLGPAALRALVLATAAGLVVSPVVPHRRSVAPIAAVSASRSRLNVVVVTIDTLRADRVGAWGYPLPTTPTLDALADEPRVTLFEQAWSAAASTIPSISALFTSVAPSRHGWEGAPRRGPLPDATTLAEVFQRAGYATGGFTANPLVSGPEFERGFEHFHTFRGVDLVQRSFLFGHLLAGTDPLQPLWWATALELHKAPGEAVVRAAQTWLDATRRPFFLYVHLMDPHWPYGDHGYRLRAAPAEPRGALDLIELLRLTPGDPRNARLRDTPEWHELLARYDQEVRHADGCVAQLLAGLRDRGLRGSTLVVLLADHGEEFLEHDGFGHGFDVFPEQVHVPLLFAWPEGPAFERLPRRVTAPVSLLDVFPTVADYAGTSVPGAEAEGRSLRAQLEQGAAPRPVLTEAYTQGALVLGYREDRQAVRLVVAPAHAPRHTPRVRVFDASSGLPSPVPYAAGDMVVTALVERARAAAQRRWRSARPAADPLLDPRSPDSAAEQLRALGYIK